MYVYCQANPVSLVYFAVSYNQLTIDEAMAALFYSQYPKIVLFWILRLSDYHQTNVYVKGS